MTQSALVAFSIEEGQRQLDALAKDKFRVTAALWKLDSDTQEWRLLICTPSLKRLGPRSAYSRVQRVLLGLEGIGLDLSQISIVDADDPLIRALRTVKSAGTRNTRFTNSTFDNVHIDDVFVYYV